MAAWKLLNTSGNSFDSSSLLVKFDLQATSYTVYVTDLSNIWSEALDRRSIIRRAFDEDTSIDPSDGPEQLKKLLGYIRDGVYGQQRTSVQVEGGGSNQAITLRLTAELPSPLETLRWPLTLVKADPSVLTKEMTIPNIQSLRSERSAVSSLVGILYEKDTVISKLRDRLDMAGIDIGSVFPGIAQRGSKSSLQEALQRSVPGLKAFDEARWRQSEDHSARPIDKDQLCREVFSSESNPILRIKSKEASKVSIRDSVVFDSQPRAALDYTRAEDHTTLEISPPPNLAPTSLHGKEVTSERKGSLSSTESERSPQQPDLPIIPGVKQQTSSPKQATPAKKRLGTLGGKSRGASQTQGSPSPQSKNVVEDAAKLLQNQEPKTSPRKPRGRLGRIGGKAQALTTSEGQAAQSSFEGELPSRGLDNARAPPVEFRNTGQVSIPDREPNSPRETSRERADRKRAELKREIEEKKKAPPKKKRRF